VKGLDRVLDGGLPARRGYLLKGPAGSGKTVLAAEYCFDVARRGQTSVFVTLLAESHGTLLENLRTLEFFDESLVARRVIVVSGYQVLATEGVPGFAAMLRQLIREHDARLVVIDSLNAAIEHAATTTEVRRFLRDLSTYVALLDCTAICLVSTDSSATLPLETVFDGIIELSKFSTELRMMRQLEVTKLRGSHHLPGKHIFEITSHGLVIHPRLESTVEARTAQPAAASERIPFGVAELDRMLRGGLVGGSSTALLGATGAGKTILGLQFLSEGLRRGEPCLYFGFFEGPAQLVTKAASIGIRLSGRQRDLLEIVWQPALETPLDALAERLLEAVQRRKVRRLFVDGVDGFQTSAGFQERFTRFLAALTLELRAMNVTTLLSQEIDMFTPEIGKPTTVLSALFENVLLLRYVELKSHVYRLLSILKVRESDYDSSIREFRITGRGIVLADSFKSAEDILSGYARTSARPPEEDAARRAKRRA
jgi:circadian clock protein KaiC